MALGIYKKGQGYWTRLMTAIGLGLVVMLGIIWVWDLLRPIDFGIPTEYVQGGAAIIILGTFAWLAYYLIGCSPRVVDFMIATEGEMKKVNWSSRREIIGSTWVVIALTVSVAVFCFIVDHGFQLIFMWMDVLEEAT